MKKIRSVCLALLFAAALPAAVHAESAGVLPKKVWSLDTTYYNYFDINERFNQDGDKEELAVDYNGALNSSVIPALGFVELGFGMTPGDADIGTSVVDFTLEAWTMESSLKYGLTDNFLLKVTVPYMDYRNKVTADLDTANATVGKSAMGNTLAPLPSYGVMTYPDTVPLTPDDVQDFIGDGLDIDGDGTPEPGLEGFGFDPVETWSGSGIGDITATGKYQFYNQNNWRFAFTGGMGFPTGDKDDPDSLVDLGFGRGAYSIISMLHGDYRVNENFIFGANASYEWILETDTVKRVPESVDQPITTDLNKERVDIDYGDAFGFEAWCQYSIKDQFGLGLKYEFTGSLEDDVSGDLGLMYDSLMDETEKRSHIYAVSLTYSTVQLYLDKKFPVPFITSISYRNRFAGKNNTNVSEYVSFNLVLFWK